MSPLHRFLQKLGRKAAGQDTTPSGRRGFSGYLVYAAGEIALIVTGILVALTLNNWNEDRKQEEQFFNILERIYQSIHEAHESVRWTTHLIDRQKALIDQLLDAPASVPDENLVYRLFNLDNPFDPIEPLIYSAFKHQSSLLAVDSGNPAQVEIATRMSGYLQRGMLNQAPNANDNRQMLMTPLLTANGIPWPPITFGLAEFFRGDEERPVLNQSHLLKARQLLTTEPIRTALLILRARKVADFESLDNQRENTLAVMELIRAHYPKIKLHTVDVGIIGSALPDGWQKSVPMQRQKDAENIWEVEITLGPGEVKFRESDSWTHNWGGIGFPEGETYFFGPDIAVQPGRYRVVLDLDDNRYQFILKGQ